MSRDNFVRKVEFELREKDTFWSFTCLVSLCVLFHFYFLLRVVPLFRCSVLTLSVDEEIWWGWRRWRWQEVHVYLYIVILIFVSSLKTQDKPAGKKSFFLSYTNNYIYYTLYLCLSLVFSQGNKVFQLRVSGWLSLYNTCTFFLTSLSSVSSVLHSFFLSFFLLLTKMKQDKHD